MTYTQYSIFISRTATREGRIFHSVFCINLAYTLVILLLGVVE